MYRAIRFKNVSRRSFAHDDVLQAHQSIEQSFGSRRTTGNVNVHGDGSIDALHRRIRVERPAGRSTGAHGDRPFGFGHLIKDATNHGPHFQGHGSGDNDQIALTGAGAEDAGAESIDVETAGAGGHHFDRTTSQNERHGPDRGL